MRALIVGCVIAMTTVASADPTAVVIVIDRSATMRGERLDLVRAATLDVLAARPAGDRVAIIAAGRHARVIAPMGTIDEKRITRALDALAADTSATMDVGDALALAATQFKDPNTQLRHVVLVTDKDTTLAALRGLARLAAAHATLSTVAVQLGYHPSLDDLANRGRGLVLAVADLVDLPGELDAATLAPAIPRPRTVVLVIDRSFSMNEGGLDIIKHAATQVVAQLAPNDMVAIVAFDSDAFVLVHPTEARNRIHLDNEIARLGAGGGTNIFTGLKEAFNVLQGTPHTRDRRVVLFTDGDAPQDGIADLCQAIRSDRIVIDVVGIPVSDRGVLSSIADWGDGRLFMVADGEPKLFP